MRFSHGSILKHTLLPEQVVVGAGAVLIGQSIISCWSRTKRFSPAITTVVREIPSFFAVFLASSRNFFGNFIVSVVFIPIYYFWYDFLSSAQITLRGFSI